MSKVIDGIILLVVKPDPHLSLCLFIITKLCANFWRWPQRANQPETTDKPSENGSAQFFVLLFFSLLFFNHTKLDQSTSTRTPTKTPTTTIRKVHKTPTRKAKAHTQTQTLNRQHHHHDQVRSFLRPPQALLPLGQHRQHGSRRRDAFPHHLHLFKQQRDCLIFRASWDNPFVPVLVVATTATKETAREPSIGRISRFFLHPRSCQGRRSCPPSSQYQEPPHIAGL